MIIDAHVHTFPDNIAKEALAKLIKNSGGKIKPYTDGTISGLLKSMELAEIDISINLPISTKPSQSESILLFAVKNSKLFKNIIFFTSIHPENKREEIDKFFNIMKNEGIVGIKIHPQYQNTPVDSQNMFYIYEKALENNIILHFHAGFDIGFPNSDYASVERFEIVFKIFRGLKVILAHGGGYRSWDKVESLLRYDNIYLDTSFTIDHLLNKDPSLLEIYRKYADRVVFGTDSPWLDQKTEVKKVKNSFLRYEEKELIFYKNYKRLLSLF